MFKKVRKGVTLIELIVVVALIGLVLSIPISMYMVGQKSHASTSREFTLQSNVRLATQKITNTIRDSSALFLFPADNTTAKHLIKQFKQDNDAIFSPTNNSIKLDTALLTDHTDLKKGVETYKGWSFIILNDAKTELREFKWTITDPNDYTKGYYTMSRIIQKQENPLMEYEITYKKKNPFYDDGLIEFVIEGKIKDSSNVSIEIVSELDSLNSLQAIDKRADDTNLSTALFYRSDDRPIPTDNEAVVAMVLDESGSMGTKDMGGSDSRLDILKVQAKEMVNKFGSNSLGKTNINIIPFDASANLKDDVTKYNSFLDVTDSDNRAALKTVITEMKDGGGTNIGDGLRRAYYRLLAYNNIQTSNKNKNKYIIFLMDGVPTYASAHSENGWYHTSSKEGDSITDEFGRTFSYVDKNSGEFRYRTADKEPVYVLGDGDINENNNIGSWYRQKGRRHGSGSENATNIKIGKDYIQQVSMLLDNVQNEGGYTNLKVFLIGFSHPNKLTELKKIEELIRDANGTNSIDTRMWVASNGGDLGFVFDEIRNIIIEDTWHIDGPDWTVEIE